MINPLQFIRKPEYFFRPSQVVRRLSRIGRRPKPIEDVVLPWGAAVSVHTGENVGSDIYHYGIFDRIVPEAILRLLDEGEMALDIGANIGQNTSLMARRSGASGRVIAFEPHPEIFAELEGNRRKWSPTKFSRIELIKLALADRVGKAVLANGEEFEHNRGSASLSTQESNPGQGWEVELQTLDGFLKGSEQFGVCKIDVEGHELSVLKGAEATLRRKAIRDLIFEDFQPQPSPVTQLLQDRGFFVFRMVEGWLKPQLIDLGDGKTVPPGFTFNYLASLNPDRARQRFRAPGWSCLRSL